MRIRWLVLTLAALLAGVMALGTVGTAAWFTDQAVVEGNTLTAGQLDIDVPGSSAVTINNLMPSATKWTDPLLLNVYNTSNSTDEVKYRITDRKDPSTPSGFYNKLNVRVGHTHAGTPGNWCQDYVAWEGALRDLSVNSIDHAIVHYLPVNTTHVYWLCFQLDESAGNVFQGASATFSIVVDATQPENPGWSE
jgi:predicted ribosomally synthesized peptide with SipW-like signal peptide